MKYNNLGQTDIKVSALCLGTMTWGTQNSISDAAAQIDMGLEYGLNFIDTAEMYPVTPISAETQGDSEKHLGEWIANSGRRKDVVIATKVSGEGLGHVRGGAPISKATITEAVEGSLRRLKTDYIDLYQLHWPNRGSYMFRQNWDYDPSKQNKEEVLDHMVEVLDTMQILQDQGKIRAAGLSNESAWGVTNWMRLAEKGHGPFMASIQNEYSLMQRLYDTDLAEVSHKEGIGLLSFSPLAAGLLTGKYQNGAIPEGSRLAIDPRHNQRFTKRAFLAVDAYHKVAQKHGVDPTQMALAFCMDRPFMTSTIFGATTLDQLENTLKSPSVTITDEMRRDITKAHQEHPMPF